MLVGQSGQHDDRKVGVDVSDAFERRDSARVGKVEVQQHAVGAGDGQFAFGVGGRLRPCAGDVGGRIGDELFYQQRIAAVVFYQ